MNKIIETTFCHFNEAHIRESGLLTPERMAAVSKAVDAMLLPCFLADGSLVKGAVVANMGDRGLVLYPRSDSPSAVEFMRRDCLPTVLSEAELNLINEHCLEARGERMEREAFGKAKKVLLWDGGVWHDDQYFASVHALLEYLNDNEKDWPEFVWAAQAERVIPDMDAHEVVESPISDRGWEDMDADDLYGIPELQAALDKFTEQNESVVCYTPDQRIAVMLENYKPAVSAH